MKVWSLAVRYVYYSWR